MPTKKTAPKKRARSSFNHWKIDVYQHIDLDRPGYSMANELDAHVRTLGIKYLHLTRPEHADSIRSEGLRSEDGMIFFTDTALTLAHIALNQVFTEEFHLFGLKHGKSWKFVQDEVAELISNQQWIYGGTSIPPDRLVDLGAWKATPPLDQFTPYPPETIEQMRTMKEIKEEERVMHLARMEKGMWPTGVLAYLEKIAD